jgi:hypothetical protein
MGHELYRMIRDGAPPGWTDAMRLVAMAIADDARDPSQGMPEDGSRPWSAIPVRGCWRDSEWKDGLAERTGLTERTLSRALTDLSRAGYEMREPISTDCHGRLVFAAKGHALRFRVPRLAPRPTPQRSPSMAGIDTQRVPSMAGIEQELPGERSPDLVAKVAISGTKVAGGGDPISPGLPNNPLTAKSSAVNSSVEGSQGSGEKMTDHDQDFSDNEDEGTCPECGQRADLMPTMNGKVVRNHSRGRDGEAHCPGTGQPAAGAVPA